MKAFTLVELLVVMSIMLILMSLAVPVYRHCADWTLDVMPEALQCTRSIATQKGYAAMLVRQDNLGTWAICMGTEYSPPAIPTDPLYKGIIDLDTKRIQVPDYEPALVVYDNKGHLCTGFAVIIDGQVYTSTNHLILDGKTKWLHRYAGGFVNQDRAPAGPIGPSTPSPRWGP